MILMIYGDNDHYRQKADEAEMFVLEKQCSWLSSITGVVGSSRFCTFNGCFSSCELLRVSSLDVNFNKNILFF